MSDHLIDTVSKILEEEGKNLPPEETWPPVPASASDSLSASGKEADQEEEIGPSAWPALVLDLAVLAAMAAFLLNLIRLKMVPLRFLLLAGGVLFMLFLILLLISLHRKSRFCRVFSLFLAVLLAGGCLFGTSVSGKVLSSFQTITQQAESLSLPMEIYVRKEDAAQNLGDLAGSDFGLLRTIDREYAEEVLKKFPDVLGTNYRLTEYGSPAQLAGALLDGEVRALIISPNLLSVAEAALDSFSLSQVRVIEQYTVVVPVVSEPTKAPEDKPAQTFSPESAPAERPTETTLISYDKVFSVYISGIDDRSGLTTRSLSDVNIIAVINPDTHQAALISTPRDYFVETPVSGGQKDKLTHAGLYGVGISRQTLEMLYDIKIDYTFRVDFSGFIRIIDALGGVDVLSEEDFTNSGYHFTAGINHMNGAMALAFARDRYSFTEGDRMRGKHQMAVINAVLKKAASSDILSHYSELLDAVAGSFETSIPYDTIASLIAKQLSESPSWNIVSFSVNGSDATGSSFTFPAANYVMIPDYSTVEKAKQLMWDVYYKDSISAP